MTEMRLISPLAFVTILAIGIVGGYVLADHVKSARIETLEAVIRQKDGVIDGYRNLERRIDAIEKRLPS